MVWVETKTGANLREEIYPIKKKEREREKKWPTEKKIPVGKGLILEKGEC